MALSNWDTLAVDQDGNSTNGVMTTKNGVSIEIYKNWLYVRDPEAWREKGSYINPTVMQIQSADLTYKDMTIHAKKDEHGTVYVVAMTSRWDDEKKESVDRQVMAGIGCYGFARNEEEHFGCTDPEWPWVGVRPSEKQTLLDFIREVKEEAWGFDKLPLFADDFTLEGALRFNQGDAYFATNLGFDLPATEVGEADAPVMKNIVDGMKDA